MSIVVVNALEVYVFADTHGSHRKSIFLTISVKIFTKI